MHLLFLMLSIWFLILAGTILLAYWYSCVPFAWHRLLQWAPRCSIPSEKVSVIPTQETRPAAFSSLPVLARGTCLRQCYMVHEQVGAGATSSVYRARHLLSGTQVAIKVLMSEFLWLHEAALLGHLSHPAFPRLVEAFSDGGAYYLAMEYVPGQTLLARLAECRWHLPLREVISIGRQVAAALAYLHSQDQPIIHQDVKPENLRLLPDGRVKVVDLGVAAWSRGWEATIGCGTPDYMPPEQSQRRPCPGSDVYALGVTLWELLSGRCPDPKREMFPLLPRACPPGLRRLLQHSLAREPERRPSAATFQASLTWLWWITEGGVAA